MQKSRKKLVFFVLKVLSERGFFGPTDYRAFVDKLESSGVPPSILPSRQVLCNAAAAFGNTRRAFPEWRCPDGMRRSSFEHALTIAEWVGKHLK